MAYQTNRNVGVSFALESIFGTAPSGAGPSKVFRANGGMIGLTKEAIRSGENRRDGQITRGRHGSRSVAGNYSADLSLGTFDDLFQAVLRGTWDTPLALTGLSLTADATAKTITRATGSWITDGLRVGDVIRFGAFTTTQNNGVNFRVAGVTALVLTLMEAPTTVASAQSGVTLSRPKKLLPGLVARSFTFEEVENDIDASEMFTGCRIGSFNLRLAPNSMATVTFNVVGQDMTTPQGASSPYFTVPVITSSIGMTSVEAKIRVGTADFIDLTALDLTVNLNAAGQPVVGSQVTPDVFTNQMTVEGSVTALRQDITRVASFLAEDQLSAHLMFIENEPEPKDFISFFLGNLTYGGTSKSELGGDGPRTQQIPLIIGSDDRGGAYNAGAISVQTSAA